MLVPAPPFKNSTVPSATPSPMTLVTSSSAPPFKEVTTPGGVLTNETLLSPPVGVLNVRVSSPSEAIGTLTVPMMPGVGDPGRVERRRSSCWRCRSSRRSAAGRVGVLANSRVWKPPTIGPVGRAERLVVSEVVEGVVDRRRRVGDRQEAGVVEAREAVERSLAVVEEDRAVLADLREDALIVGVVGLAGERAGGQLAEDVQGVACRQPRCRIGAGVEGQARRIDDTGSGCRRSCRCSSPGCRRRWC